MTHFLFSRYQNKFRFNIKIFIWIYQHILESHSIYISFHYGCCRQNCILIFFCNGCSHNITHKKSLLLYNQNTQKYVEKLYSSEAAQVKSCDIGTRVWERMYEIRVKQQWKIQVRALYHLYIFYFFSHMCFTTLKRNNTITLTWEQGKENTSKQLQEVKLGL